MTSQNGDSKEKKSIQVAVQFRAEVLVDVETGSKAELAAREYLTTHPEILKLTTLSCDPGKIRAMKKAGCIPYPLGGQS